MFLTMSALVISNSTTSYPCGGGGGGLPASRCQHLQLPVSLSPRFTLSKHHRQRRRARITPSRSPPIHPLYPNGSTCSSSYTRSHCASIRGVVSGSSSPWDDKPYEILPTGKKVYLDEEDIVSFLDPPRALVPLDPSSYNPASYLWKKIDDIPEERRHRLLDLLDPRLISRVWGIAGTRYDSSKLRNQSASNMFLDGNSALATEFWHCRKSGGPIPIAWINLFKKVIFGCKDGKTYGRLIGDSLIVRLGNMFGPLYFVVSQQKEVMATEEPCDLAYVFGDGLFDLHEYPKGFPKSAKHPWPLNDEVVVYVRHVGPGVVVGQAWQEGKRLEAVPRKLCGDILMVKDYLAATELAS